MNKFIALTAAAALLSAGAMSCQKEEAAKSGEAKTPVKTESKSALPNYRYVDIDTILSKYNLAKDYNEEMTRKQTQMENEVRSHQTNIQSKANSIQQKMQSNGYTSEASYKADTDQLAAMQNSAQKKVGDLETKFQSEALKAQQTVQDSIDAFIKDYNASHGYDAILFKNATLYINPALDITNEVVEGLNARYNKVKK
ncbi:MAG: OmpH family outer membrane protein [Prevotella sp.]|nr:OmpH family outer membrane protein [Bacteroides sp.]MCM1366766.1 OmpH family outer membrane protein [Prevotella sp.]MCM1437385.1 OmpH family outer membrane protein [Prevotella sp.]